MAPRGVRPSLFAGARSPHFVKICTAVIKQFVCKEITASKIVAEINRRCREGEYAVISEVSTTLHEYRCNVFMLFGTGIADCAGAVLEVLRIRDEGSDRLGPRPAEYDKLFEFLECAFGAAETKAIRNDIILGAITNRGWRKLNERLSAMQITLSTFHTEYARLRTIGAALRAAARRQI